MKVLLVCATEGECGQLLAKLQPATHLYCPPGALLFEGALAGHQVSLLITGIGMVNIARTMGALRLEGSGYDLLLNFGIAGSFLREVPLGAVVQVVSERFAELGAEDGEQFLDLAQLGFPSLQLGGQVYYNHYTNPAPPASGYLQVRGITLNRVSGSASTIVQLRDRFQPELETMESAAFFQMATAASKPFLALRAISNYVEPRNVAAWQLHLAIQNIQKSVLDFLQDFKGYQ